MIQSWLVTLKTWWDRYTNPRFQIKQVRPSLSTPRRPRQTSSQTSSQTSRQTNRRGSEFQVEAQTRPKTCPVCRTPNRITRLPSSKWQCEACQHQWRG